MTDHRFFLGKIQQQIDAQRARYLEHGWEFTERVALKHNLGDFIGAVMQIENADDAQRFYRGYVAHLESLAERHPQYTPQQVADMNIGWCFGEGMSDERKKMWCSVTTASHPIFGCTNPTPEEALNAGIKAGDQLEPATGSGLRR